MVIKGIENKEAAFFTCKRERDKTWERKEDVLSLQFSNATKNINRIFRCTQALQIANT